MSNNLISHFSKLSLSRKATDKELGLSSSSSNKKSNKVNNLNNLTTLFAGIDIDENIDKIKRILNMYNVSYNESELNSGANASSIQFKITTHSKTKSELKDIQESIKLLENNGFNVKKLRNNYIIFPNLPKDTYKPKIKRTRKRRRATPYSRRPRTMRPVNNASSSERPMNIMVPLQPSIEPKYMTNNNLYRQAYRSAKKNTSQSRPFRSLSRNGTMYSEIPSLNRQSFVKNLRKLKRNQLITQKRNKPRTTNIRQQQQQHQPMSSSKSKKKTRRKPRKRVYNSNSNYVPSE